MSTTEKTKRLRKTSKSALEEAAMLLIPDKHDATPTTTPEDVSDEQIVKEIDNIEQEAITGATEALGVAPDNSKLLEHFLIQEGETMISRSVNNNRFGISGKINYAMLRTVKYGDGYEIVTQFRTEDKVTIVVYRKHAMCFCDRWAGKCLRMSIGKENGTPLFFSDISRAQVPGTL